MRGYSRHPLLYFSLDKSVSLLGMEMSLSEHFGIVVNRTWRPLSLSAYMNSGSLFSYQQDVAAS